MSKQLMDRQAYVDHAGLFVTQAESSNAARRTTKTCMTDDRVLISIVG